MDKPINDGGPAFARPASQGVRDNEWAQEGMTLRDYFAAKALQGAFCALADPNVREVGDVDNIARDAYRYADAMLKARSTHG